MPISIRLSARKRRGKIDARELVRRQGEAAAAYLGESLNNGYRPADGAARPRKPLGFDTGTLARGIRVTELHTTRIRASVRIAGPSSRDPFVAKHPDILTLDGIVADEIRRATDAYLEEIDP